MGLRAATRKYKQL